MLLTTTFAFVPIRAVLAVFVGQIERDALFAIRAEELLARTIITGLGMVDAVDASPAAAVYLGHLFRDDVVPASELCALGDIIAHRARGRLRSRAAKRCGVRGRVSDRKNRGSEGEREEAGDRPGWTVANWGEASSGQVAL